jgi:septal ring factor EnvC (AmiA/AmiB activator)
VTGQDALVAVLVALASGGLVAGIVAFRKAGPERTNIIVDSAEVIIRLGREEVDRLDQRNDRLENRLAEMEHELKKKIAALEAERDALKAENAELRDRIKRLETTNGIS